MRNSLAPHTDDPSNELNFSKFLVSGVPEATEYLRSERFVFVGAPNRWRKEIDGSVVRADIRPNPDGGCVVLLFQWQRPSGDVQ
ncbi:MAG TPA: hypothetical protein VD978_01305 [Azospirillum sp.]|nr:hypothetical protein [Azospirillum sp.]